MDDGTTNARCFIPLSGKHANGRQIEVSPEDYEWARTRSWFMVGRYPTGKVLGRMRALHRMLMGEPEGMEVDHIDGNRLNARRDNLRICTRGQNACNRKPQKGFKGVGLRKAHVAAGLKPWRAAIQYQGKEKHLGFFATELEAAAAYNAEASKLFGEFARLNELPK